MRSIQFRLLLLISLVPIHSFAGTITGTKAEALVKAIMAIPTDSSQQTGDCNMGKCVVSARLLTFKSKTVKEKRVISGILKHGSALAVDQHVSVTDQTLAGNLSDALEDAGAPVTKKKGWRTVSARWMSCHYNSHQTPIAYECDVE
jgi:hypothetical protein